MTTNPHLAYLIAWIVDGAPECHTPEDVVAGIGRRLASTGLPIDRLGVFVETLHPSIIGRRFLWEPGKPVDVAEASFASVRSSYWNSPVRAVAQSGEPDRYRLSPQRPPNGKYPVLDDLARDGFTDYIVQPLPFTDGSTHVVTWATKRETGFSDADLADLELLRGPLARLAEVYALKRVASNLLDTYVGERAGRRILAGQIHRGDIELIEAAIWLSDLRDFTNLSESVSGTELIEILNRHFDCLVPAVRDNDGEVLKFMGDGMLAIFPSTDEKSARDACLAAHAAALDARRGMAELNDLRRKEGQPQLGFGIALHRGEVHYGNIGGSDRLDFTAIGPAVNMAARIGTIAAAVNRDIVASADFVRTSGIAGEPVGSHAVKGIDRPVEVFGIPGQASTAAVE